MANARIQQVRSRDYLQSGQQPVPTRRVAADAPVAAKATSTVATAIIFVVISVSFARFERSATGNPPLPRAYNV